MASHPCLLHSISVQLCGKLHSKGLPAEGIEPTRSCDHWILSPARLPIPPRRRAEATLQKGSRSSSASRYLGSSWQREDLGQRSAPIARLRRATARQARNLGNIDV